MQASDDFWSVELVDGTLISVEPDLANLSSYVLIEQEDWLEKEIVFIRRLLRPGMRVIDIGANIGIYALVMARLVGPSGQVMAIEPQAGPRRHLERGAALNRLANVEVLGVAVADAFGTGRMESGEGSEAASLQRDGGPGSGDVAITTLDHLVAAMAAPPDFIKIDAEGAERSILAGGRECLARHQPILMVEVKARQQVNTALLADLRGLGFDLYRALPGGIGLVPYAVGEPLDDYELNVFACRPSRAAELEERGLLARERLQWHEADDQARSQAVVVLRGRSYAAGFRELFDAAPASRDYADVLAAYLAWSSPDRPLAQRYAALRHAFNRLADLLTTAPTLARLMTLMRLAAEAGQRKAVVALAAPLLEQIKQPVPQVDEPFLPPHPRYDALMPAGDRTAWLLAAFAEQFERARMHSSQYAALWPAVINVCVSGYASTEMFRRVALRGIIDGTENSIDPRLLEPAPDHRNAALWRRMLG